MSGDRHLRQDPEGRLNGQPEKPVTVLVIGDERYSATLAGQYLLQLLTNLLGRLFGVVDGVWLDVPEAPIHPGAFLAPPVRDAPLSGALKTVLHAVSGGQIWCELGRPSHADVIVAVGPGIDPSLQPQPAIAVVGSGWTCGSSTERPLIADGDLSAPNCLGPHLAAALATGFVFKASYQKQRPVHSLINMWPRDQRAPAPDLSGVTIPDAYLIGLGAVGAAFGTELAGCHGLSGRIIAMDPQDMSETDRNRLLTGTWDDVGRPKAQLLQSTFAESLIDIFPFQERWPDGYLGNPRREVPDSYRAAERAGQFEWIICCVDRNRDRAAIGEQLPRHVLAGSTYGMAAQTAYYSIIGAAECIECRHRTPAQLGVEELAHTLRELNPEQRSLWYSEHGATQPVRASIEEYLSNPTCAGPGAADLAKLNIEGPVDWAVGFVSATSGILLAARFISSAMYGSEPEIRHGSEWRYFFWPDELRRTVARRDPLCPRCGTVPPVWNRLWPPSESPTVR